MSTLAFLVLRCFFGLVHPRRRHPKGTYTVTVVATGETRPL